jgi:hypothetical protein
MHPGSCVLWGCSASPAILTRSPQLSQGGGLSVLSSIRETEKSRVVGVWQSCCLLLKIFWWRRKYEMVHCGDTIVGSFVAKVWGKFYWISIVRNNLKGSHIVSSNLPNKTLILIECPQDAYKCYHLNGLTICLNASTLHILKKTDTAFLTAGDEQYMSYMGSESEL